MPLSPIPENTLQNTREVNALLDSYDRQIKNVINGRTWQHIREPSFLKTWEIVLCAITVIGLFVLLGLYYKRRNEWVAAEKAKFSLEMETPPVNTRLPESPRQNIQIQATPTPIALPQLVHPFAEIVSPTSTPQPTIPVTPTITIPQNPPMSPPPAVVTATPPQPTPKPQVVTQPLSPEILKARKEEILKINSAWNKVVKDWKELSIELDEEVWLLEIAQLNQLGVLDNLKNCPNCIPDSATARTLLKEKALIEEKLAAIKTFECKIKMDKLPSAIDLLVNLESLKADDCKLVVPPDVSKLLKLNSLELNNNKLKTAPDVSKNVELEKLGLNHNKLETPPNVTNNTKLVHLWLDHNKLKTSPDLSKNTALYEVCLRSNKLETPPDVSKNLKLGFLLLGNNSLKTPPDVSHNVELINFHLENNPLGKSIINVKNNPKLERIWLKTTKLTNCPDFSQNLRLSLVDLSDNRLKTAEMPPSKCLLSMCLSSNYLSKECKTKLRAQEAEKKKTFAFTLEL